MTIDQPEIINAPLPTSVGQIIERLGQISAIREFALSTGRQVIRSSANAIRALHRGDRENALTHLIHARTLHDDIRQATLLHPSIYWAGYVQDASKEYAEAAITTALLAGEDIPDPTSLGIEDAAYLNAMAEAASELRRDVLDQLREGEEERASHLLDQMDAIYSLVGTVDFPDALTGGLRRTTDQLRAVLERTRGDVTLSVRLSRLEKALDRAEPQGTNREVNTPASAT